MTRTTTLTLALALCLPLAACGGSKGTDENKTQKPKDEPAEAKDDAKAEAEAPAEAKAEGYEGHLLTALEGLAAGKAPAPAETKPYGCSVKYADEGGEAEAKVGEPAPAFTLSNLEGEEVSLADFAGKVVVLEWFNPDCPFVKYAHGEGPLATLAKEQSEAGVVWLAINSGAPGKQGADAERNEQAKAEWKIEHPILIDADGKVGHSYGAKTTPHMFIVDAEGKLVYAGSLDNAPLGRVEG
jgi:peroxiredoxin